MKEEEFLKESNAIEGVYDEDSLQQALYAWEYLSKQIKLTYHVLKKTHKILMLHQDLLPNEKGYYRRVPVWIGGKQMRWENVDILLDDWIEQMNTNQHSELMSGEEISQDLHVKYEKIHPFVDGNGRTGRMFMNWWRVKNGLPILVIHEGKEQMEYYKWFK
ncbi:MAG TPA: Fic family protein [Saprospiraceae bacterium]|nr:Fic family protein [Saprospiraceae bacterium]